MNVIRRSIGNIALVVFILSAFVHIATYFQIDLGKPYPGVWGLLPAAIAIHICGCVILAKQIGLRPGLQVTYRATLARMPEWTWVVMAAFFVYMLTSAALFGLGLAVPELVDGRYIIRDHQIITEYTFEETQLLILYQIRVASEFWMWLTLIWTLFLLTSRQEEPGSHASQVISQYPHLV
jgi:hypothetical protein